MPTLVTLLEEFAEKYGIDALGMSIPNLEKHLSAADRERLDAVVKSSWLAALEEIKGSPTEGEP